MVSCPSERAARAAGAGWWYVQCPEHVVFPTLQALGGVPGWEVDEAVTTFAAVSHEPGLIKRALAALGVAVCAVALVTSACVRETPETRKFVTDAEGRALILHGANVSSAAKSTPDHLPLQTEADIERMGYGDWGMNLSRFLIQWQQLEPEPGVYDDAYLDAVAEQVAEFNFVRHKFFVLVDAKDHDAV